MRKAAVLKAFYQESIWLAVNLFGIVCYVVKTRQFSTPDYAVGPNPIEVADAVQPIFEVFFVVNLIWAALVIFAIPRGRKTASNVLPMLFAFILWPGTFLYVNFRIDQAIEDVQEQELRAQSSTGKNP